MAQLVAVFANPAFWWTLLASTVVSTALSVGVALLTAKDLKGPRSKEGGVQNNDYGAPIPQMWGPLCRSGAGTIIWYSGLKEHARTESGSGGSNTTFTYTCSAAKLIGKAKPGATLSRVWLNKKLVYERGEPISFLGDQTLKVVESITLYDGGVGQGTDPTIEAAIGAGNWPTYEGDMYIVLKEIQLADFGPMLPYIEVELGTADTISPAEVVSEIGDLAGVDIDVSRLDGNVGTLDGYVIDQDVTALDAIAPLMGAYFFRMAERGGGVVCIPNGMRSVAQIPAGDLGCVSGKVADLPEFNRAPESELPQKVTVTYLDISRDMQPNTVKAERDGGNAKENISINLPLVLDEGQATRIANVVLWGTVAARRTLDTTLSDKWLDVLPGDVADIETPVGSFLPFLLNSKTRGADGVSEVELAHEDGEVFANLCSIATGDVVATVPKTTGAAGKTTLLLLDIPILRDAHDNSGFYYAVVGAREAWPGALTFRSTDGGTDYTAFGGVLGASLIGTVAGSAPSGPTEIWDRANTIRVTLLGNSQELESKSELAILNGANTAWIGPSTGRGGEIIQFVRATLVSEKTYDLTVLLRGRRGTEWAVDQHVPGEYFVLLSDNANLARADFTAADLDLARSYKAVTGGGALEDTTARAFTNTGEGLRPFSPERLVGRRSADEALSISWVRRSRLIGGGLGGGAPSPLGEDAETYQLDIYEPADEWAFGSGYVVGDKVRQQSALDYNWRWYVSTQDHTASFHNRPDQVSSNWSNRWREITALRTLHLADQTFYTYAAAAQTIDGITPGDPVILQCRQISGVRGFGHPALSFV